MASFMEATDINQQQQYQQQMLQQLAQLQNPTQNQSPYFQQSSSKTEIMKVKYEEEMKNIS